MTVTDSIDIYLPARIRQIIEQRYLAKINRDARLNRVIHDPHFYSNPLNYPPFFADHGIVHHHDVARRVLEVLDIAHGLLIPAREEARLEFMKGYGVLLASIHDIGMTDFSLIGRAVHPMAASQTVFGSGFDDLRRMIWQENCGNLAWRLSKLADSGALEQDPELVLREMLAMSNCHSKSNAPIRVLNDPHALRSLMQAHLTTPLPELYYRTQIEKIRQKVRTAREEQDPVALERSLQELYALESLRAGGDPAGSPTEACMQAIRDQYADFGRESYIWLVSNHPEARRLVADVTDTLRALRCSDALRQRGTVLKTSGGDEVFVDQFSANAIIALRLDDRELYLLELDDPLSAGEANISSSQIDRDGNLRISFHRGTFFDEQAVHKAASHAAVAVDDIQADVIQSFIRPDGDPGQAPRAHKPAAEMEILLECPDDNLEFADLVAAALEFLNPNAAARTRPVPSLDKSAPIELERYLQARDVGWDLAIRREVLQRIALSGHKTGSVDPVAGFQDVRHIHLKAGEHLIEAGDPSTFVYIPLGKGLRVIPLGGYASFPVQAWMPLGITGVIRGAGRNAAVIAESPIDLLMIPKKVYLQHWHHTHSIDELVALFQGRKEGEGGSLPLLTRVEKHIVLQKVPLFTEVPPAALDELAEFAAERRYEPEDTIFAKGEIGDSLYVVASGRVRIHDGDQPLNDLAAQDVFGEMALLDPEPRMASATALEETRLLRLDRERFQALLAQYPDITGGILLVLSRRLRDRAREVIALKNRLRDLEPGKES